MMDWYREEVTSTKPLVGKKNNATLYLESCIHNIIFFCFILLAEIKFSYTI